MLIDCRINVCVSFEGCAVAAVSMDGCCIWRLRSRLSVTICAIALACWDVYPASAAVVSSNS